MTAALKELNKLGSSSQVLKNPAKHKLVFAYYTKCTSMHLVQIWIIAFCPADPFFFLLYIVDMILSLSLTMAVVLRSSSLCIARYQLPGDCENYVIPFLHIPSCLDKALIEKPMIVQGGLFCFSILSPNTSWQQWT